MIRNLFFLLLTFAALVWIFFAGQELINFSGNENPERLFGQEDGRVFILNRPLEIQVQSTDFQIQPRLSALYTLLKNRLNTEERMLVSERKAHIVLERNQPYDAVRIRELFQNENLLEITTKKFLWNEFTIERNKGVLQIYIAAERPITTSEKWYTFDKKSACSIVQFNPGSNIVTDFYQKGETITSYCRSPFLNTANKEVNDKVIYANRIPVFISSYQFMEREYASRHDPVFLESVALKWANQGLVYFEYKKRNFLLMDISVGKEPNLYLSEFLNPANESGRNYTDIRLTQNFPNNPKAGFFMRIFDEHVLFAENEEALIDLEASLEIGQMLSLNKEKCAVIYNETPKKVCFRAWTSTNKIAKSAYNGSELTVEVKSTNSVSQPVASEKKSSNYSLDSRALALQVHATKDLVFAISETNHVFGFGNGKNKFQLNLKENTKKDLQWVDDNHDKLLITGLSNVHVVTENGQYSPGFPVSIPEGISSEVSSFQWKGKTNYLVANNSGFYVWLDEKGAKLGSGKMEISRLTTKPIAWVSQKRLFFGFQGDGEFSMIEAEKNKLLRNFPIPTGAHSCVLTNEIVFYAAENDDLYKYNQRGSKIKLASHPNMEWIKADKKMDGSFYVKADKQLYHYSETGKMQHKIKPNSQSIESLKWYEKTAKGTIIGLLDGMNNKIELYRVDGKSIPMDYNTGQNAFGITTTNGLSKLYTISDKFIIHYEL